MNLVRWCKACLRPPLSRVWESHGLAAARNICTAALSPQRVSKHEIPTRDVNEPLDDQPVMLCEECLCSHAWTPTRIAKSTDGCGRTRLTLRTNARKPSNGKSSGRFSKTPRTRSVMCITEAHFIMLSSMRAIAMKGNVTVPECEPWISCWRCQPCSTTGPCSISTIPGHRRVKLLHEIVGLLVAPLYMYVGSRSSAVLRDNPG